nr:IS5 family transposase [uncultured Butyricicoccus sp.]
MKRYELTKEQWERVKPLLPPEKTGQRGRPRKDNRIMLNGMLRITRSGAQWRELPEAYGPWQSVYARFAKWRDDGTLKKVFRALSEDADTENLSMDSTCIKVHESANGGEKRANKAVGRTRGGLNTKLHAIVDSLGNPVEFLLSAGNDHDCVHAVELLETVEISGSNVLADRAYGAQAIREYISERGATYVIPPQSNISKPWSVDWHLYKERHLIECFFQKIKWFRRIATRYHKLDASFLAFVYLASIAILVI